MVARETGQFRDVTPPPCDLLAILAVVDDPTASHRAGHPPVHGFGATFAPVRRSASSSAGPAEFDRDPTRGRPRRPRDRAHRWGPPMAVARPESSACAREGSAPRTGGGRGGRSDGDPDSQPDAGAPCRRPCPMGVGLRGDHRRRGGRGRPREPAARPVGRVEAPTSRPRLRRSPITTRRRPSSSPRGSSTPPGSPAARRGPTSWRPRSAWRGRSRSMSTAGSRSGRGSPASSGRSRCGSGRRSGRATCS